MTARIGRNRNSNDVANIPNGIAVSGTVSTVIAIANSKRIAIHFNNNDANKGIWIKLQAALIDDDKKGIYLSATGKGESRWDMPTDNVYTGEISAIGDSGAITVFVTEY